MTWIPCCKSCRGLCPCPEPWKDWGNNKTRSIKKVDPQKRWLLPGKGYRVATRKKMVCGYSYVGEHE